MHFLVTGAQGFLGAYVVKELRSLGNVVTATGRRAVEGTYFCNLNMPSEVAQMINTLEPDRIVHCAAQVPTALDEYHNIASAQESLGMLDAILATSSCPLIYISSMTVYGGDLEGSVEESKAGHPTSAYGKAKWECERHLLADGRPALAVRIPGLFGLPRRNGLVYNFIYSVKNGRLPQPPSDPILWASMHVEDAAKSIAKLATSSFSEFEAINIGYRERYSINELMKMIGKIYAINFDYSVRHPYFEFDLKCADSRGVVPQCSLNEALVRFGNEI